MRVISSAAMRSREHASFRREATFRAEPHALTAAILEPGEVVVRREDIAAAQPGEAADDPEADLVARQQRDRLYAALGTLPDKLREAFVARAIEGLSLVDAAAALGAPISTVSYRTRRAEQLLCAALEIPWRES